MKHSIKSFNVADSSKIESAILYVDYDDGFIAYINDVEVARSGMSGIYPSYNATADANHEAQIYSGGSPEAFVCC